MSIVFDNALRHKFFSMIGYIWVLCRGNFGGQSLRFVLTTGGLFLGLSGKQTGLQFSYSFHVATSLLLISDHQNIHCFGEQS